MARHAPTPLSLNVGARRAVPSCDIARIFVPYKGPSPTPHGI